MCDCTSRPSRIVAKEGSAKYDDAKRHWDIRAWVGGGWAGLYRCLECGQYWEKLTVCYGDVYFEKYRKYPLLETMEAYREAYEVRHEWLAKRSAVYDTLRKEVGPDLSRRITELWEEYDKKGYEVHFEYWPDSSEWWGCRIVCEKKGKGLFGKDLLHRFTMYFDYTGNICEETT